MRDFNEVLKLDEVSSIGPGRRDQLYSFRIVIDALSLVDICISATIQIKGQETPLPRLGLIGFL